MRRPGLTVRQAEVLSVVRAWVAQHGYPPTTRELGTVIGVSSRGAHEAMLLLERKGCLTRDRRPGQTGRKVLSRTLRIVGAAPGPVRVHLGSAVVAHENGKPAGVAYQVTPAEPVVVIDDAGIVWTSDPSAGGFSV